jgi:hypothetical protein
MNQRINQLIEECTEYLADKGDTYFDKEKDTYFDKEKFAELIVRECAKVCLAQRDPANLNYKPSERFAEAVKLHFGVKQ